MNCNVGGADRVVRLVVGVVLVAGALAAAVGYWAAGPLVWGVALVAGAVLLVTGTTRRCPVNDAAGIDTSR